MAVDKRQRRHLDERAERVLGTDGADTLMALLPPVGWGDVATKQDLDALRAEMHLEIGIAKQEIINVRQEIINVMTWRMLAMFVAFAGLVAALAGPLGH